MILFSNGCSFLTPRPKDGVDTFTSKIISEKYGMELHNIAMGGRGNHRISFTTKLWCEQHKQENFFVILGWSSMMRNDYVTDDGWKKGRIPNMDLTWRTWKIADNISFVESQKGWDIEKNLVMQFLDKVVGMQNYFVANKIPYVMYNSLPNYVDTSVKDFATMSDAIDFSRFFSPKKSQLEFIQDNDLIASKDDPHPSAEGHQRWATQLMEFIDANNLRTIQ
jgi:hypothetical protein